MLFKEQLRWFEVDIAALLAPHPPRHSHRHGHTGRDGRQCMPTNDRFGTSEMAVFAHLRRPHGYLIQSDWFFRSWPFNPAPWHSKTSAQKKQQNQHPFFPLIQSVFLRMNLYIMVSFRNVLKCHPWKQEKSRKSHQIQSLCFKMLVPQNAMVSYQHWPHFKQTFLEIQKSWDIPFPRWPILSEHHVFSHENGMPFQQEQNWEIWMKINHCSNQILIIYSS